MSLDRKLLNYENIGPPLYLDGRYFNIVVGRSPYVSTKAIVIKITHSGITSNIDQVDIYIEERAMMYRIIIEVYDNYNKLMTRHSNLLIFDNENRNVSRFEPLIVNQYNDVIDTYLIDQLSARTPMHQYLVIDAHPQPTENLGLCVAYVLKYAYFSILGQLPEFKGESDIVKFALTVHSLYKSQLQRRGGRPDIEFGLSSAGQGALLGGLGGAAIGGLAGGAGGALLGLGLGATTGAVIGSSADRRRY